MARGICYTITLGLLLALVSVCQQSVGAETSQLTDKEFQKLHAALEPATDEPWRTIPWQISLLDAQKAAAQQNKPIFIWAMDGHPLGCT